MANYKNQHFVPRCYLKPFTQDREGRALNLYNLDAARSIPRVSARDQCSGDYFYGDDLKLEKRLQPFEASYGQLLDRIQGENYRLNADDRTELRRFWLLQHLRTEAASRRTVEMFDQLEADAGEIPQGYRTNIKDAVKQAMSVFFDTPDLLDDLSVCLVRNTTDRSFITSDNPAVMGNRWHQSDRRAIGVSPGLQNAGMVGLLPLSPEILCLIYDGDLHTLPNVAGWVNADRTADIDALNAHQVLNCAANLYFAGWSDRTGVETLVAETAGRRLPARFAIHHAVLDRIEDGAEVFKVVPAAEARLAARSIVHSEALLPTPQRWPSILRWRTGGRVYDSGTAEGFVRDSHPDAKQFRRLRVRP